MGSDILTASPAARSVFARMDAALGVKLSEIIASGPDATLTLTENAQPAILGTSYAILSAALERYPELPSPTLCAGHSLGEYTALVAAGALSLEDGVRLVRARGLAMQAAVPQGVGSMIAVIALSQDIVEGLCQQASQGEVLSPANLNAPGQIVVAGHTTAIDRLKPLVEEAKGKVIPLKVSAPFHCALMEPARTVVAEKLMTIEVEPARFPVVANADVSANTDPAAIVSLLCAQVTGVVRWEETVRKLRASGITHVIEWGPGKVLSGLVKRIDRELKILNVHDEASLSSISEFVAPHASRTPSYHELLRPQL